MRLTGDASSFRAMLATAKDSVQATAKVVDSAVDRIQSMGASITQFSRSAVSAFGALGLKGSVEAAFDSFAQLERGIIRLNAAIEVNGGNVAETTAKYKEFANQVVSKTLFTKAQIYGLLQEAEALGKTGEAAVRMTTNAMALSKGNTEMAKSQMHVANMLEQGNIQALRRILRMHGEKDETKLLVEVQKRMAAGLAILTADANTTWGQIQKLKRSFVELNQEVGSLIAEAIKPVVKWLQDAVAWFKSLDAETRKTTVAVIAVGLAVLAIGPALGVVRSLLGLFSPIGVAAALAAAAVTIWVKSVGGLANAWEIVQDRAAPILEFLVNKLTDARDVAVEFFLANQKVLGPLILLAGAVGLVVVAVKALILVSTVANFLATALGVNALLSAAAWVGWSAAVLAWKGAMLLASGVMAGWNLLMAAGTIGMHLFAFAEGVVTAATAILEVVMAPGIGLIGSLVLVLGIAAIAAVSFAAAIAAVNAAVGLAIVAFASVGAAAAGVWEALGTVWEVFSSLPRIDGPLKLISSIFREWGGIIKDVASAATVSLPLAFEIVKAGLKLAIAQAHAYWPPLWDAFKMVGLATIDLVVATFQLKFNDTYKYLEEQARATWERIKQFGQEKFDAMLDYLVEKWVAWQKFQRTVFNPADSLGEMFGAWVRARTQAEERVQDRLSAIRKSSAEEDAEAAFALDQHWLQERIAAARNAIKEGMSRIPAGEISTPEIEAARAELDKLRVELKKLQDQQKAPGGNKAADWAAKVGDNFKHAYREIHKVQQALFGTAEASQRIEEWRDLITLGKSDKDVKSFQATLAGGGDAAQKLEDANDKLAMIVEFSRQTAAALGKSPPLIPAGFGGGGGL